MFSISDSDSEYNVEDNYNDDDGMQESDNVISHNSKEN